MLREQSGSYMTTLGPKEKLYSYMDPLGYILGDCAIDNRDDPSAF